MPDKKPNVKKQDFKETLLKYVYRFSNWLTDNMSFVTSKWIKMQDMTTNNFDLGQMHLQLGNTTDAIFRFKIVTWLEPKHIDAWFFLGTSYMAANQMPNAVRALNKALELKPGYEEAIYMRAIAKGKSAQPSDLPKRMPISLAKSHFDSVASTYRSEQIDIMRYEGHILLCNAIRQHLILDRVDHEVLELGVGTGLCGPLVRNIAARLIGVDMSTNMLSEAMQLQDAFGRKVYDILIKKEMHDFLKESPADAVDVVMSATALSYVGDLSLLFPLVAKVLRSGGVFAFTVDPSTVPGFILDSTVGRFRFSSDYLVDLAEKCGLKQLRMEEIMAYPEYKMLLCVFAK
jgi:predicted TPR repeat methyltransferase